MTAGSLAGPEPLAGTPPARPRSWPGYVWGALAVLIFAGWFVATRFTMTHSLRVWDVLALRFGIGAIVLLPVLLLPGRRLGARAWGEGLVFAGLWGGPFVFLIATGIGLTSAAEASAVTPASMPVFAGMLAWALYGERPSRSRFAGFVAIVSGLVVLVSFGLGALRPDWLRGTAALVAASLMWAIYTIRFRRSGLAAPQAAALICVWTSALFLPVYWLAGLSQLGAASTGEFWFQALYQGVLVSAVAIIAFNEAVRYLGAGAAAAIAAAVPVTAVAISAAVLHEVPSSLGLAAIVVIACGVLLAARPQS